MTFLKASEGNILRLGIFVAGRSTPASESSSCSRQQSRVCFVTRRRDSEGDHGQAERPEQHHCCGMESILLLRSSYVGNIYFSNA